MLIGPVNVFAISPLVGAKWTLPNGFGVSSQAGVTWAPGATGVRVSTLYNVNVGWAF